MIAVKIEKELRQDNRIFGNFTFRQVGCFGVAAVIEVLFYLIVRPGINNMVAMGMVLGTLGWYFGFHKKNGLNMEFFLWKKVKEYMLKNNTRTYRTKNKYITMLNSAYLSDKNADMTDKIAKKEIKRLEKEKKKKLKSNKKQGIKGYR